MNPTDADLQRLINRWYDATRLLEQWKTTEKELRRELFKAVWGENPPVGTHKQDIGYGMQLVGEIKLNYTLDETNLEAARNIIPPALFETVISYKPKLIEPVYKSLDMDTKTLLSDIVTEKPSLPTLKIKPITTTRKPRETT